MMEQAANALLMIEPVAFGFNEQTAKNNYFQQQPELDDRQQVQQTALSEFRDMVQMLQREGIRIITIRDTVEPSTPDSIFPNNWVSFHSDGRVVLYPMYASNRRLERRLDILDRLREEGFVIHQVIDYTESEARNRYLEGTGSMVLDHVNRVAFASLSERTDKELFFRFCRDFDYSPVVFHSFQTVGLNRLSVYHTNVMMMVAGQYAVVCLDAIDDRKEREQVLGILNDCRKTVIPINEEQMHCFAGNMLQVKNENKKEFLVLSESASGSLSGYQRDTLLEHNSLLVIPIPTIERYGGGSVRCMLAEIFLP